MQIIFGADHGGFELKEELKKRAAHEQPEINVEDLGAHHQDPTDDYPQYGFSVAQRIAGSAPLEEDPQVWGILICRSGGGIAIAANRIPGVRAVVCRTLADIEHARRHNNANVLVLEGDSIGPDTAWKFVLAFTSTPFDGGRHTQRVISLG